MAEQTSEKRDKVCCFQAGTKEKNKEQIRLIKEYWLMRLGWEFMVCKIWLQTDLSKEKIKMSRWPQGKKDKESEREKILEVRRAGFVVFSGTIFLTSFKKYKFAYVRKNEYISKEKKNFYTIQFKHLRVFFKSVKFIKCDNYWHFNIKLCIHIHTYMHT